MPSAPPVETVGARSVRNERSAPRVVPRSFEATSRKWYVTPALQARQPDGDAHPARPGSGRLRVGARPVARARAVLDPPAGRAAVRVDRASDRRRGRPERPGGARHDGRRCARRERLVGAAARPRAVRGDEPVVVGGAGREAAELLGHVDRGGAVAARSARPFATRSSSTCRTRRTSSSPRRPRRPSRSTTAVVAPTDVAAPVTAVGAFAAAEDTTTRERSATAAATRLDLMRRVSPGRVRPSSARG